MTPRYRAKTKHHLERRWIITDALCTQCELRFVCKHLSGIDKLRCPVCDETTAMPVKVEP